MKRDKKVFLISVQKFFHIINFSIIFVFLSPSPLQNFRTDCPLVVKDTIIALVPRTLFATFKVLNNTGKSMKKVLVKDGLSIRHLHKKA